MPESSELERQAFNYSVLAEVSRLVNNFMLLEDFFNFSLELLMEYTGRTQGIFFLYSPERHEFNARTYRLYQMQEAYVLVPVFDEKAGMIALKVDSPATLEHNFSKPKLLSQKEFNEISELVPSFGSVADLYGMQDAIVLVHQRQLKGIVLLGGETRPRNKDFDDPGLLEPIVDLLSTSIENIILRESAVLESLTGAYTHRYFLILLGQEIERALVAGESFVLLMADIDSFKSINDTYGHLAGDRVLQRVAEILRENIRDKLDFSGRYGGDEFLLFLSCTDMATAYSIAERIRISVKEENFEGVGTVTVSIGVSEEGARMMTVEELVGSADKALYRAKETGGNAVALSQGDLQSLGLDPNRAGYERYIKDRITAFYSGPYFLNRVESEIKRARRYGHAVSIVAMGISQFSRFRPALKRGDIEKIFHTLSNVILQHFRKGIDIPGRFANELILFLLPETDEEGSRRFLSRIMNYLDNVQFPVIKGFDPLRFNAGISSLEEVPLDATQLISHAVEALEKSQSLGEGKIYPVGAGL